MPRNGSGTYSPPAGQPVVSGTPISSTTFNALVTDIGTEITRSLATDGQTPMGANLPMGGNKIVNLAAGSLASDAVRYDQHSALADDVADLTTEVSLKANSADLAASSGSSLIGFIQTGTGATSRTALAKLRESVSVKDFGAVGDGVTDDTTAIRAAIADAIANGIGLIWFPRGTYRAQGLVITDYTGDGISLDGQGATILLGANETGVSIVNSENVHVGKGLTFRSAAISGINQIGVLITNSGRCVIEGHYQNLTYGIKVASTKTGLVTGAYPIPIRLSPIVKACAAGVYCAPTGEYVDIVDPLIQDCTLFGVTCDAGNVKILGGVISGNDIGIYYDGSASSNGDHGAIIGVTANHNAKANLYLLNIDKSMLVTGCNFWAAISEPFGTGLLDTAFGVYLQNVKNVNLTSNVIAHNLVNLGYDGMVSCTIANNTFKSDPDRTVDNIRAINPITIANGNRIGPNTFEGAIAGGGNNDDPEQLYAPTYLNSWVDFGGVFHQVKYWKDANGVVHLIGTAKTGGINTVMFNLPVGFRPGSTLIFSTTSADAFGMLQVQSNGDVLPKIGSSSYFSLDGVSFKAEG